MQSNQYFVQSELLTRNGTVCFGGIMGVDMFKPEDIQTNQYLPTVQINKVNASDISAENEESFMITDPFDTIILPWDQNRIEIEFFAINYTFPKKTSYKYRITSYNVCYTKLLRHKRFFIFGRNIRGIYFIYLNSR